MAEPTSTSSVTLTAILIGLFGPLAGPYALIVMAALAGALWPLSTMSGVTRRSGAFFLMRIVFTAVVLTGAFAYYLEVHHNLPALHGSAVVAFFIGALGNGWTPVFRALREGLTAMARALAGGGR